MNQNNSVQQDWDDTTNRQPQSRQEHILQQLSAIKEVCIHCLLST